MDNQLLSACGLICNECNFFGNECQGCYLVLGAPFWAKEHVPGGVCPLYKCSVMDRKYAGCGQCAELPCELFKGMKDPNCTDEEHVINLRERVSRLKKNA
ncbi:MAG: DUF3795 domain-containing protein [Bacteroidales bacterium]|jgi:hypothetical protein|nr:DUF3795 domain-containing protein [Bacteroidales bacterium]MDD4257989.1 DUF3795 domain-containing protein [Bacteroidales bacterium]MDD4827270.1 DUF3795 domain-containing protein [Bacteroidales bacterium]HNY24508.1 DUF3795 domain-containing protein [Bacteroidales bacterium]HPS25622.1 DUF3795 domain-containing protein [Bacteroidales bacterium]